MSEYSNGYLKFWLKSTQQLKIELEGPQGTKDHVYVASTSNQWKEISLALTNFPDVVLTNMYGLFAVTASSATTNYVDNVYWSTSE